MNHVEKRCHRRGIPGRFGKVEGYDGDRLPAPALPNATIAPRKNPTHR